METQSSSCELLPEDYSQYDVMFKVIVLGDSFVGKSCLTIKATKDFFQQDFNSTVGFEIFSFNSKINSQVVKLQIWDTCGQEIYRSLIANYYRNCSCSIIVFSIDNKESFSNVGSWIKDLKSFCQPDIKIFLVGNKCDLENQRKVTQEEIDIVINEFDIVSYTETSAKTGFNTKQIFINVSQQLLQDNIKYQGSRPISNSLYSKQSSMQIIHNENIQGKENNQLGEKINPSKSTCLC